MPVYKVPATEGGQPEGADRLTADPSNYSYHHRGDYVYVASENSLNVYDEMVDEGDAELVEGDDRYETREEDGEAVTVALYPTPSERSPDADVEPFDDVTREA